MEIVILECFIRQLKPYVKKHRAFKEDVIVGLENFNKKSSVSLGKKLYKFRLKSKNILKGRNKSFRIIVLVRKINDQLVPISIFFKGDKENISKKEINKYLEIALNELLMQDIKR